MGNIPMVLIQNKIDLIDKAVITTEEAQALAEKVPSHPFLPLCPDDQLALYLGPAQILPDVRQRRL